MEFDELIESFAALHGIEGTEIEGGATTFVIDDIRVTVFHDADADAVMVYGDIGQPPPESDRAFAAAMLKANHLFGGTGGAVLCQDPETEDYAIFQSFPLDDMDAESLAEQLARIVDKADHWRDILNAFKVAERERGEAAAEEILMDALHGGSSDFITV